MSMVNAYITDNFIVMTGDYRRVLVADTDVYYDDAPKVSRVNERVILGLTGDYNVSIDLRKLLGGSNIDDMSAVEVAELCRQWLVDNPKEDTQQSVTVAGLDSEGSPVIITVSHSDGYTPQLRTVEPERIEWSLSYANESPEPYITEELGEIDILTPDTCAELAKNVNEKVAEKDSYVSPECDVLVMTV